MMSAYGTKLRHWAGDGQEGYHFWCPGCDEAHMIKTSPSGWGFNDSGDAPTFTPSVLVRSGHYLHGEAPGNCYCDFAERHPEAAKGCTWTCCRCHSFVTDGHIQFLGDCTHALAGQTVPLPDYPAGDES